MTLIVHGVLNGSKGSLYYPLQEISKEPGIWNHIPIVVYHPTINGENVSAKDPGVLDRSGIGILRNSKIDGDRLRAEGWFDVERTRKVDPRVLNALENNRSIELSTGLYTENEPAPMGANYKGVGYEFIARNYKPDHLAILPDQIGACGIRDGCGVLVNTYNTSESTRVYRTASGKILFIDNCGGKGGKPGPCKGWKGTSATKPTDITKTPATSLSSPSTKDKESKTKTVEVAKTPTKATQKPKSSKVIEQHSIPQGTFGPSKAEIEFEGATHKKQMESLAKKFLGTKATTKDLASIAGAPDGATVRLEQGTRISDSVTVRFQGTHDGHEYNASRTIYRKDGELVVKNNIFHGKGVGIEVFGRQVENATRLGAKYIEMSAAGSFTPGPDPKKTYGEYNGYYTWPRMGVDDKVPSKSYSKLPPVLKKDVDKADGNVRGLMGTEKGRDWWLRNGTSLDHAKFDLKPGSYSQKTLASYLASRKGKGEITTSNMSESEDDKQSNEIHQDDIDWDTLDAVNDHVGIKESKSNDNITVSNTRVYRTASGRVLLVDNVNPEGCNQYKGCEGGDSGSDRKARISAKREEYNAKVEKIKETISPEHAQAVHDTIKELGGHVRSKLSGITKGADENDLLDGIRKKGVDIGPTGLKGYKLLDKMQFVGWLGKGETGGDSLSPKVVRYHLPMSDEGLALNSPTPLNNSNPEGCNQYKGCEGGGEGEGITATWYSREVNHSDIRKVKPTKSAGMGERVRLSDGRVWEYKGISGHAIDNKSRINGWQMVGRAAKVKKVKDIEEPVKSKSKKGKVEDHPEAIRIADESFSRHKERIKGIKDWEIIQSSLEQHKQELKDAGVVPTETEYGFKKGRPPTSNESYVDVDTVSNSPHTISFPVVVPPTFSRGDKVGDMSVSPVELSSNSTRLERFIHWLISNRFHPPKPGGQFAGTPPPGASGAPGAPPAAPPSGSNPLMQAYLRKVLEAAGEGTDEEDKETPENGDIEEGEKAPEEEGADDGEGESEETDTPDENKTVQNVRVYRTASGKVLFVDKPDSNNKR